MKILYTLVVVSVLMFSCGTQEKKETSNTNKMEVNETMKQKANEFVQFTLKTDLSVLTEKEKL